MGIGGRGPPQEAGLQSGEAQPALLWDVWQVTRKAPQLHEEFGRTVRQTPAAGAVASGGWTNRAAARFVHFLISQARFACLDAEDTLLCEREAGRAMRRGDTDRGDLHFQPRTRCGGDTFRHISDEQTVVFNALVIVFCLVPREEISVASVCVEAETLSRCSVNMTFLLLTISYSNAQLFGALQVDILN